MRWWFQEKADADGWQLHEPLFFAVRIDGHKTNKPVMRRKEKGRWVYRELTEEEAHTLNAELAW